MRHFYRYFVAASQLILCTLLLCFGSCRSDDNVKASEGASVASLPLNVCIDGASSRVDMSDIFHGASLNCYWNSDMLSVYQKYILNGSAVQSMTGLTFSTTATNTVSATFSYDGSSGAYCYNPGSRLYAFSKGTGGGYTAIVAYDGTSTLTAPTFTSQNGTLSDCAKYDALYGSANVNSSTGLPEPLTIHHLFGMMNLHLTGGFTSVTPVTVRLTSSANILPGNEGCANLNADGTINTLYGSWNTSWSATITPTADGKMDVYFMTWPFSAINGTLTVSCSDANNNYADHTVTLNGFSLPAATLKSNPLTIFSDPKTSTQYSTLAEWATNNSCPSPDQIKGYLDATCYWDTGFILGGNMTDYKINNGATTTRAGMWFKKTSGATGSNSTGNVQPLTADLVKSLNLRTNYFFLPAAGYINYANSILYDGGMRGYYWSSTSANTTEAYSLHFDNASASLKFYGDVQLNKYSLWRAQ